MREKRKRIESETSRTAEFNCIFRAASYLEKSPQYKSEDNIAIELVSPLYRSLIKIGAFKSVFNRFFPPGMYEYVIARTKFIDSIFKRAILREFDQILIFRAGFDSRGIRFADLNKKTRIFELDAPITQEAKISQLNKRGIKINPNIVFISVDFNKESAEEKIIESGFDKNKKSLFILGGLIYYLSSKAVDNTFNLISRFAGEDSEVVFDYIYSSVLKGENLYYGESEVFKGVKNEDEPWSFGLEKGEIEPFIENRNLN
jgi:methyltransferase (TIGR00027 family)